MITVPHQQQHQRKPLVLIVDNREDCVCLLVEILKEIECSYIAAENGGAALTLVRQYSPDLILLDMMLPVISGLEVLQRLKQDSQTEKIPVIAVTAIAGAEHQKQFLSEGCIACVTKPYDIDELEAVICKHLSVRSN